MPRYMVLPAYLALIKFTAADTIEEACPLNTDPIPLLFGARIKPETYTK